MARNLRIRRGGYRVSPVLSPSRTGLWWEVRRVYMWALTFLIIAVARSQDAEPGNAGKQRIGINEIDKYLASRIHRTRPEQRATIKTSQGSVTDEPFQRVYHAEIRSV